MCCRYFRYCTPRPYKTFNLLKKKADILIASVTSDKHVTKSKDGPYVPEYLRANNLASLEMVDYVLVDYNFTPLKLLSKLKPITLLKVLSTREMALIQTQRRN